MDLSMLKDLISTSPRERGLRAINSIMQEPPLVDMSMLKDLISTSPRERGLRAMNWRLYEPRAFMNIDNAANKDRRYACATCFWLPTKRAGLKRLIS